MAINWMAYLAASVMPFIVGFLWYNVLFNKPWMKASGMTEERIKGGNMALIFGLSFVFNLMLMFFLHTMVIHQMHLESLMMGPKGTISPEDQQRLTELLGIYGDRFRSFGHGALHGAITGIFFVLPVIGVVSLYERKSWQYVAINAGYWTVLLAVSGAIICGWR